MRNAPGTSRHACARSRCSASKTPIAASKYGTAPGWFSAIPELHTSGAANKRQIVDDNDLFRESLGLALPDANGGFKQSRQRMDVMSDDTKHAPQQDQFISLEQDWEAEYWAKKF